MNNSPLILPQIEIPPSAVPQWEQFPQERQDELIQALAALLLHLSQLQAPEKELSDEHRQ
jgi:hypothetical protein